MRRVITDNGSCYRSRLWRDTLTSAGISVKKTRPYRPQTNGKVERFHRTLTDVLDALVAGVGGPQPRRLALRAQAWPGRGCRFSGPNSSTQITRPCAGGWS
ncbi:transposase family protein [Micromonospora sp. 4G55]|nr:transposase family protein [Micromonospora sp. 4G55]